MLTQILIKDDGCRVEYTKIAAHSFGFIPSMKLSVNQLFIGGSDALDNGGKIRHWSANKHNVFVNYFAGALADIESPFSACGIAIPINFLSSDTITLSGTAFFKNAGIYTEAGFTVKLLIGVYYFNCQDLVNSKAPAYTFIPVSSTDIDKNGSACFSTSVLLSSNFDTHNTRLVIGYNLYIECPSGECIVPEPTDNGCLISYTLDAQRPCEALPSQFIIKNCCEGSITEHVNIQGLVVGDFHVDNEGNCWEVISETTDVTNFTRTFTDTYTSCLECQAANPCPLNLTILSCCVEGTEFVTGSLPGLSVGDTFVDNYGLCWYVGDETSAPISEESITVGSIITGNCETCKTENPCPKFYYVQSCCTGIGGIIAVPDALNFGDSFVDAQGQCWNVTGTEANTLPTIYGIEVVTVYPFQGVDVIPTACDLCITANPCPTEYFITIKSCCDPDRVEVAQVPADYMFFTEGTIFSDYWKLCWEVTSFSTTGVATFEIWPWLDVPDPNFREFKECKECLANFGCAGVYNVKDCQTDIVYNNIVFQGEGTIGGFYSGYIKIEPFLASCFEVLSYGYPTYPDPIVYGALKGGPFTTCEECQLTLNTTKVLEFSQCCGGPNIIVEYTGGWYSGVGALQAILLNDILNPTTFKWYCVTLVGFSTGTPTLYNDPSTMSFPQDCAQCIEQFGCP